MELGVYGLGTMGTNLARNAMRSGARVIVGNRTVEKVDVFMKEHGSEGSVVSAHSIDEFLDAFTGRKAMLLMVKAGDAVDEVIDEFLATKKLKTGDILIDAGNSLYKDTMRREKSLQEKGIVFIGMGVSGGEEGALKGPSMMPGGDKDAVEYLMPLLTKMAAQTDSGSCVSYIGPNGAGHYVKMVHNGVEYGIMQLIAEAYDLLRREAKLDAETIANLFEEWSTSSVLSSYLMEIAVTVLRKKDELTGGQLIDLIKDTASQKGTGKWTVESAMELGVSIPTITAAVDARIVSSGKDFRVQMASKSQLPTIDVGNASNIVSSTKSALILSIANAYAQGWQLIESASKEHHWNLSIPEIARIWTGGCIIRSNMLPIYQRLFSGDRKAQEEMKSLFTDAAVQLWRSAVVQGVSHSIPLPAMSASLSYYDAYRTEKLPANMVAALRDCFGAHTYERLDQPGSFHTDWSL